MGVLTNLRRRIGRITNKSTRRPPSDVTAVRGNLSSWPVSWVRGDYTMQNSELIFSAVSRISNALSAMPVQLYRGSSPVKNSPIGDLVSAIPNPNMTSTQFFKTLEACRGTSGNAYALKVFNRDGVLERLDPLDPTRVTPILEEESRELWYRVLPDPIASQGGAALYFHNYYMIHIPFISTNGYQGLNPVSVLFDTLSYGEQIERFSASQLERGVNASVILEAPANLGEQQKRDMLESFLATYKETSGNILLLESGVTAKKLDLSPVDAKLFEVEKITRSKVAMVYNIPPHLMGDYSDTSFSSQEQQMLEFLMLTMLPIVTAYEQELNRKLLTKRLRSKGYHFKFDMDSTLRADSATRADVYQKAIRGGWMTPNEVRGELGREPRPEGGKLLTARDMTTLEYILQNPAGESGSPRTGEEGAERRGEKPPREAPRQRGNGDEGTPVRDE